MNRYIAMLVVAILALLASCTKIDSGDDYVYGPGVRNVTEIEAGARKQFVLDVFEAISPYGEEDEEDEMVKVFEQVCLDYDGRLSGKALFLKGTGIGSQMEIYNPMVLATHVFK